METKLFGFLTVIQFLPRAPYEFQKALCLCECGTTITTLWQNVRRGNTKSCGCLRRRAAGLSAPRDSDRPEYQSWQGMNRRCSNAACKSFPRYGGRGIRVCDRWRYSFSAFFKDMGPRPSAAHTLDRRDNNGNYEPGNCRWATWKVQQRNRRNNSRFQFGAENLTLAEWSERTERPLVTLRYRLFKLGWTIEQALTTLPRQRPT